MQFHNLEAETTISAQAEMVVILFPETLQFPQFGLGNISGPPEKIRRFQVRETPKSPRNPSETALQNIENYPKKGEKRYAENVSKNEA